MDLRQAHTHLQSVDQRLATLIDRYPDPSFSAHTNYYQELVSSIISQQLSVVAAAKIEGRFIHLFNDSFPTPQQLLETDTEQLRTVGLSRPKINYIQDLAMKVLTEAIDLSSFTDSSNDTIISELTKVKGIGEWTAHMFLIFCMGRMDVLPKGDLGIRKGVELVYDFTHTPTPEEVTQVAEQYNWHPYESIASWYMWQSLKPA